MLNDKITLYAMQFKNGDISALERLYGLTYNHVYFIIYHMVNCREDAQDILQDTYIRAFSKIQTLKEPASFYAWIIKIAVNLSKNHIKRNKTVIIEKENDAFFDSIIYDNGVNITERIENTETRGILFKLLDMLPDEQKRAVLLYYYENMTVSEIAEIEETSVSTITSRLSYARAALRKAISAYEKKNNMKLYSSLAVTLSSAIAMPGQGVLLSAAAATETFIFILNALGLGSFVNSGVKFISGVTHYDSEAAGLRDRIRRFVRTRFIFEVKPLHAGLTAVVFLATALSITLFINYNISAARIRVDTGESAVETAEPDQMTSVIQVSAEIGEEIPVVGTFAALKKAVYTGAGVIKIEGSVSADSTITISYPVTITGGEIKRYDPEKGTFFKDGIFRVIRNEETAGSLTLKDITVDGCCYNDKGDTFTREADSIIDLAGGTSLILDGAVIKNNYVTAESGSTITGYDIKKIDIIGGAQINNCRSVNHGGAVSVTGGEIYIREGCSFTGNASEQSGGVVAVYPGGTLNINGAEFIYNKSLGDVCGGGVISSDGQNKINITDSNFNYNEAFYAGGVLGAVNGAEINIIGSVLENNTAGKEGGILYMVDCKLLIDGDSRFISNRSGGIGGAILADRSEITLNSGKLTNNIADRDGGAVFLRIETVFTINGGIISGNSAGNDGGGINMDGQKTACLLIINGGEICENSARYGGGISNLDSAVKINGGLIYENCADSRGGGVFCRIHKDDAKHEGKTFVEITGGEIYENNAVKSGGGIHSDKLKITADGGSVTTNSAPAGSCIYLREQAEAELISGNIDIGGIEAEDGCVIKTDSSLNLLLP